MAQPPIVPPPIQQALLQQPRPPVFISFAAEIVPQTTETLIRALTDFVNQGFREVHLLLSTPGGSVMHGITIYNVLRGLPITLTTHNVGNVDSIGAVVYLAGERRYTCQQSTFMLHGVAFGTNGPTQFFEKTLKEKLATVQRDQERIQAIYRERAGIQPEVAEQMFLGESNINADDAVRRGLAHEVRPVNIPAGSPVFQLVFNRQGSGQIV
jgi:ATP-dependent Clp protease, protease subunit